MFTGIVEAQARVVEASLGDQSIQVLIEKPAIFDDLNIGDSVACNGVCLTVESFNENTMAMTIGFETLQITGWKPENLIEKPINLERSLRFGDRIHGHMVSGHVDTRVSILSKRFEGECLIYDISLPSEKREEIWAKSSVALNGVSLTVNGVNHESFQVCLIPETLRKTNLENLSEGEWINLETDYYMKGLLKARDVNNA